MMQTQSGARELSPSTGANDSNGGEHVLVTSDRTPSRQGRRTPAEYPYNPNEDGAGRRCSVCGERGRWRRVLLLGGAWVCCPPAGWVRDFHDAMPHTCGPLCEGGRAA